MNEKFRENKVLGIITFITSVGDWLTYFALIHLTYQSTGSVVLATLTISMKSLAIVLGAIFVPVVVGYFSTRSIIFATQWVSCLLIGFLCFSVYREYYLSAYFYFLIFFVQTALKQIFDAAREQHSKMLAVADSDHRTLQSEIVQSLFGAQLIGPLLVYFLLRRSPWLPLAIDAGSFMISGLLAFGIRSHTKIINKIQPFKFLRPFSYLNKNTNLRNILILRSVIFWIPNSLFNFLIFQLVVNQFSKKIDVVAILYAVLGMGASVSSVWIRSKKMLAIEDRLIAFWAQVGYGVCCLGLALSNSSYFSLVFVLLVGILMGFNTVSTQSLRRKFSSTDQFPEVISLELLMGRFVDFGILWASGYIFLSQSISSTDGFIVACILFAASGGLHLKMINPSRELRS